MNKDILFYPAITRAMRYNVDPTKRCTSKLSCGDPINEMVTYNCVCDCSEGKDKNKICLCPACRMLPAECIRRLGTTQDAD